MPEYDSTFAFTVDIPSDVRCVTSSYSRRKCQKCGSFLLQLDSGLFCPICNPDDFAKVRDSTSSNFFQVEETSEHSDKFSIIFFLFDLDCEINDLLSVVKELIKDAEGPNSHLYQKILFNFAFLGSSPQLFKKTEQGFNFYPLKSHTDILETAKPILEYKSILDALVLGKKYLRPFADKTNQLTHTYKVLSDQESNTNFISDLFYFFTGNLPSYLSCKNSMRSHFFQFAPEPSRNNMECAIQIPATYFVAPSECSALHQSIVKHITCHGVLHSKISIATSPGISFSEIVGPSNHIGSSANIKIIDAATYSKFFPFYGILKVSKDEYSRRNAFSIQMLFIIAPGIIYVVNEVWLKAKSNQDWLLSFSKYFFEGYYVQKSLCDKFNKVTGKSKLPWSIATRNYKIMKDLPMLKLKLSIIDSFLTSLLITEDFLPINYRFMILLQFFYGEPCYLRDFMQSVMDQNFRSELIYLPPFIFSKGTPKHNSLQIDNKQHFQMYPFIEISEDFYTKLRARIESFQARLISIDPK